MKIEIFDLYIFFLAIALGIILMFIYTWKTKKSILVFKGYHLHHSLYGFISFFFALILYMLKISKVLQFFFIGLGIGIILQHILTEKFCFIEKVEKYKNKTGIFKN